jgi:hypothetical protein
MNDRQRSKHDSNLATRNVCNKESHRALWSALPAWTSTYDQILAKISYVNACVLIQTSDTTGITRAKNEAREKLEESTLQVGGGLCALALLRGDTALEAKTDFTPSELRNLADTILDDRATEVLQLARAVPAPASGSTEPSLTDVGLTEGKLDLLETRIETYNLLLGSPRAARGEKTAATVNLQRTLDEIDRLWEKVLDKLILQFKGTDFYIEYTQAREPIAVGSRKPEPPPAPPA